MGVVFAERGLDSVRVANALRYAGKLQNRQLNQTQINKLLYIVYGTYLVEKRERLTTEHVQAWPYGPVFPRVQKHVRLAQQITSEAYDSLPDDVKTRLNVVVSNFGELSAQQLTNWSHGQDSPWTLTMSKNDGKYGSRIEDEDIYDYFYNFIEADA